MSNDGGDVVPSMADVVGSEDNPSYCGQKEGKKHLPTFLYVGQHSAFGNSVTVATVFA